VRGLQFAGGKKPSEKERSYTIYNIRKERYWKMGSEKKTSVGNSLVHYFYPGGDQRHGKGMNCKKKLKQEG